MNKLQKNSRRQAMFLGKAQEADRELRALAGIEDEDFCYFSKEENNLGATLRRFLNNISNPEDFDFNPDDFDNLYVQCPLTQDLMVRVYATNGPEAKSVSSSSDATSTGGSDAESIESAASQEATTTKGHTHTEKCNVDKSATRNETLEVMIFPRGPMCLMIPPTTSGDDKVITWMLRQFNDELNQAETRKWLRLDDVGDHENTPQLQHLSMPEQPDVGQQHEAPPTRTFVVLDELCHRVAARIIQQRQRRLGDSAECHSVTGPALKAGLTLYVKRQIERDPRIHCRYQRVEGAAMDADDQTPCNASHNSVTLLTGILDTMGQVPLAHAIYMCTLLADSITRLMQPHTKTGTARRPRIHECFLQSKWEQFARSIQEQSFSPGQSRDEYIAEFAQQHFMNSKNESFGVNVELVGVLRVPSNESIGTGTL